MLSGRGQNRGDRLADAPLLGFRTLDVWVRKGQGQGEGEGGSCCFCVEPATRPCPVTVTYHRLTSAAHDSSQHSTVCSACVVPGTQRLAVWGLSRPSLPRPSSCQTKRCDCAHARRDRRGVRCTSLVPPSPVSRPLRRARCSGERTRISTGPERHGDYLASWKRLCCYSRHTQLGRHATPRRGARAHCTRRARARVTLAAVLSSAPLRLASLLGPGRRWCWSPATARAGRGLRTPRHGYLMHGRGAGGRHRGGAGATPAHRLPPTTLRSGSWSASVSRRPRAPARQPCR